MHVLAGDGRGLRRADCFHASSTASSRSVGGKVGADRAAQCLPGARPFDHQEHRCQRRRSRPQGAGAGDARSDLRRRRRDPAQAAGRSLNAQIAARRGRTFRRTARISADQGSDPGALQRHLRRRSIPNAWRNIGRRSTVSPRRRSWPRRRIAKTKGDIARYKERSTIAAAGGGHAHQASGRRRRVAAEPAQFQGSARRIAAHAGKPTTKG